MVIFWGELRPPIAGMQGLRPGFRRAACEIAFP